jgi:hypothetical protein
MLPKGLGEALCKPVVHDPTLLPARHKPSGAQHPQSVGHRDLAHRQRERQVAHTEFLDHIEAYSSRARVGSAISDSTLVSRSPSSAEGKRSRAIATRLESTGCWCRSPPPALGSGGAIPNEHRVLNIHTS